MQYTRVDVCPECSGSGVVDHPAWAAVYAVHARPHDLLPFQVALAMIVGGYSDDVTVTARNAEGLPIAWEVPPRLIPCACQEPQIVAETSAEVQQAWFRAVALGYVEVEP